MGVASSVVNDVTMTKDIILRTGVASAVSTRGHNENDVIMGIGAASAIGARRHNENDVTMTIAGSWRYDKWRHVATGCNALVNKQAAQLPQRDCTSP